jgi:hypothetical protein
MLLQHLVSVVTITITTTMGVAIVSIATNWALLVIRIATWWSCSNTIQLQRNTGVAFVVIATRRRHCNRVSLLPRHLISCYRWLRLLQRFCRLVAIERSFIVTLFARDSLSVATIIIPITTTKCGCYTLLLQRNMVWFPYYIEMPN